MKRFFVLQAAGNTVRISFLVTLLAASAAASSLTIDEYASADVFSIAGETVSSTTPGEITATSCCTDYENRSTSSGVSVDGTVDYGALSGSASISHSGQANDWYSNGSLSSQWSDTVTLQPGTYFMTMIFDSTTAWDTNVACNNSAYDSASATANFWLPGIYGGGYGISGSNGTPCFQQYWTGYAAGGTSALDQVITGSFTVSSVTTTQIDGSLSLAVGLPTTAGPLDASVDVPTVLFYLDGVTPGATYTSASGTDYGSAPEPGTFALGLPLLALAGWHAARRRRDRAPAGLQ